MGKCALNRKKSRRERYDEKKEHSTVFPISLCAINFMHDGNIGYLIRAAACFGAERIHVIGSMPEKNALNRSSGTLSDYVKVNKYNTPVDFLDYAREKNYKIVSAELVEDAEPIDTYDFDFNRHICLVVGNEQSGIPTEILKNSEKIYIPMPGVGYCLNTSQAANIMLYEAVKQYKNKTNQITI